MPFFFSFLFSSCKQSQSTASISLKENKSQGEGHLCTVSVKRKQSKGVSQHSWEAVPSTQFSAQSD